MNVYRLRPQNNYSGGMALVAAPTIEDAMMEYMKNGIYKEEFKMGEFTIRNQDSQPLKGLEWHGEQHIICDSLYFA